MKRLLISLLVALIPACAWSQATVLQGGSWSQGYVPTYSGSGGTQPIIQNSGPAAGTGVGIREQAIIARGTGTAPYAGQGSGPLGTVNCTYDAPVTNATGYHYLCLSANAQGGGLIAYGAGGGASNLPLSFTVNGSTYEFPFSTTGVLGPATSTVGHPACWNNSSGTLLADCPNLVADSLTAGGGSLTQGTVLTANGVSRFGRFSVNGTFPSQAASVSIASPAVVSATGHGFQDGSQVMFATTGSLPTGITVGQVYYVIATGLTADTFQFSTSRGGSAVNTSGTQSGVHSVSNALAAINGQLFVGNPSLAYQPDIGKGNGGIIVYNNDTPYIIQRNMAGGSIPIHHATDADDLDGYWYTLGTGGAGILSGARSSNWGANFGNMGFWTNLSAGSASARNVLTILGVTAGSSEGNVGLGGITNPTDRLVIKAVDNTVVSGITIGRASMDFGARLSTDGSSGFSTLEAYGAGSQLLLKTASTLALTITSTLVTSALNLTSAGTIRANTGFSANGTAGLSTTKTVRDSAGTGTCTLVYSFGLLTGGTC